VSIYWTDPLFALPVVIPAATAQIEVALTTPATTFTATLAAGTYYVTLDEAHADDLAKAIITALNAAEVTALGGAAGTWSGGWGYDNRVASTFWLKRDAGAGTQVVASIEFLAPATLGGADLGFAADLTAAPSHVGGETVLFLGGAARWCWLPHRPATVAHGHLMRGAASARSAAGKSAVLVGATYKVQPLTFESVRGCLVLNDLLAVGYNAITNLRAEDVNATLERFWIDHGALGPMRYYPDAGDSDTWLVREIDDADWLGDPVGTGQWEVAEVNVDYWRIEMPLKEVVT
jgi:hypothetical protein